MFGAMFGADDGGGGGGGGWGQSSGGYWNGASWETSPPNPRRDHGLTGLLNQGTTCYLNSLVQLLYMTPELRDRIYALSDDDLGTPENPTEIPEVKQDFSGALAEMGFDKDFAAWASQHSGCTTQEDVMNWMFDPDNEAAYQAATSGGDGGDGAAAKKTRWVPLQLQRLFAFMQLSDQDACSTRLLTKSFGWEPGATSIQHDVQELNRVLFDAIERQLQGTEGADLINSIYRGFLVNNMECLTCHNVRQREESFLDVPLQVKNCHTILDSLVTMVGFETMDGSNAVTCEICDARTPHHRSACFQALPQVLTFGLNRFSYDWQKQTYNKINARHAFPLVLDMAPYCEGKERRDAILVAQQKLNARQAEEEAARARREAALAEAEAGGKKKGKKKSKGKGKGKDNEDGGDNGKKADVDLPSEEPAGDMGLKDVLNMDVGMEGIEDDDEAAIAAANAVAAADAQQGGDDASEGGEGGSSDPTDDGKDKKAKKAKKSAIFDPPYDTASEHLYELFGIVIHIGGTGGGHYHAYIRDLTRDPAEMPSTSSGDGPSSPYEAQCWFDFNDSSVHGISLEELATQYGAAKRKESAYMLVYRHVTPNTPSTFAVPAVPDHLRQEIELHNAELVQKREEYELRRNTIALKIHTVESYEVAAGGGIIRDVFAVDGDGGGESMFGALDMGNNSDNDDEERPGVFKIEFDKRRLFSEFTEYVREVAGEFARMDEISVVSGIVNLLRLCEIDPDLPDMSLEDLRFYDRAEILVWSGTDIKGVEYTGALPEAPRKEELTLVVRHFVEDGVAPTEHVVTIMNFKSVYDLKTEIQALTNVAPDDQLLCKYDHVGLRPLRNDSKELRDELSGVQVVSAEFLIGSINRPDSIAIRDFDVRQNFIELKVIDRTHNADNYETFSIDAEKDNTVEELKIRIVSVLKLEGDEATRAVLRRCVGEGMGGAYLQPEDRSLLINGLENKDKVIVELAEPEDTSIVVFVGLKDDKNNKAPVPSDELLAIPIDKHATVAELLTAVAETAGINRPDYRLRATNFMQEAQHFLDNEGKQLHEAGVSNDDVLWAVKSVKPTAGGLTLTFYRYLGAPSSVDVDAEMAAAVEAIAAEAEAKAVAKAAEEAEAAAAARANADDVDDSAERAAAAAALMEMAAMADVAGADDTDAAATLLGDLYEEEDPDPRDRVPLTLFSPAMFLKKHVDDDEHAGREGALVEPVIQLSLNQDDNLGDVIDQLYEHMPDAESAAHLRLWAESKLVDNRGATLKKNGLSKSRAIVVQVLDTPDALTKADTLIFVYQRLCGAATYEYKGEAVVSAVNGAIPVSALRSALEPVRPDGSLPDSVATLRLYKYNYYQDGWTFIHEGGNGVSEEDVRADLEKVHIDAEINLKKKPFSFQHGDVVVYKDPVEEAAAGEAGDDGEPYFDRFGLVTEVGPGLPRRRRAKKAKKEEFRSVNKDYSGGRHVEHGITIRDL